LSYETVLQRKIARISEEGDLYFVGRRRKIPETYQIVCRVLRRVRAGAQAGGKKERSQTSSEVTEKKGTVTSVVGNWRKRKQHTELGERKGAELYLRKIRPEDRRGESEVWQI